MPGQGDSSDETRVLSPRDRSGEADGAASHRLPEPGVARYVLLECLGRGGPSVVYAARDTELSRRVAIKLLRLDAGPESSSRDGQARLLREAQALAKITHPNVIPVYDVGRYQPGELRPAWPELLEDDEFPIDQGVYVVMEIVEGDTLAEWLRTPRSWQEVLDVVVAAGRGLAAAHAKGLVHRDFKPGNVMIGEDGRVKVLDFGLARTDDWQPPSSSAQRSIPVSPDLDTQLTQTGTVLGTPKYMAPEQHRGQAASPAADQYSLCLVLCEALCGRYPFASGSLLDLRDAKEGGTLPPMPSGVPKRLWRAMARGLSTRPEDRFASMEALLAELEAVRLGRKRLWMAAGAAVVLGLGASIGIYGWLQGQRDPCEGFELALVGVWDTDVKQAAERAFLASDRPYAPAAWSTVAAGLDAYVDRWVEVSAGLCRAARDGEASTDEAVVHWRNECMHDALAEVRELGRQFRGADADIIARGAQAVSSLPSPGRCAEHNVAQAELLQQGQQRELVSKLRRELAAVRSLVVLGGYDDARERAQQVLDQASEQGLVAVRARARFELADTEMFAGDNEAAEAHVRKALTLAEEAGDDDLVTRANALLIRVLQRALRLDEAETLVEPTAARLRRRGLDDELDAEFQRSLGWLRYAQGRVAEGVEAHRARLRILERELDPEHLDVAIALLDMGSAYQKIAQYDEAEAVLRRVLTIFGPKLGPDHPRVASARYRLAGLEQTRARYDEALAHATRALEIWQVADGPDHYKVASAHNLIGAVYYRQKRYEDALEHYRRAKDIYARTKGPEHPNLAMPLGNIGLVLSDLGRREEALETFEEQLRILDAGYGPDHLELGTPLTSIASLLLKLDRPKDALPHAERAVALRAEHLEPGHDELAFSRYILGLTHLRLEDLDAARAELERAVKAFEDLGEFTNRVAFASALMSLAKAAVAEDRARAIELTKRARDMWVKLDRPKQRDAAEKWLREHGAH